MYVELKKTANDFGPTLTLTQPGFPGKVFETVDDCFGIHRVENFLNSTPRLALVAAYEGCGLRMQGQKKPQS